MGETAVELPQLPPEGRAAVAATYLDLLARAQSPLLATESLVPELLAQLDAVLDIVGLCVPGDDGVLRELRTKASARPEVNTGIGSRRAAAGVNPTESLLAAGFIFQAALPTLAREWQRAGVPQSELTAALALNWAIAWRMSHAATAYVEHVLGRTQQAHQDERRRVARDLHDEAAHAVGLGMQYLELSLTHLPQGGPAVEQLARTRAALVDAVGTIRGLSAELRDPLDAQSLVPALLRYLETRGGSVPVRVEVHGDVDALPASHAQEFYLVLREAIHNALRHARAGSVDVELSMADDVLSAQVTDDGCGFETARVEAAHDGERIGLTSMAERVELLGGVLTITSEPDRGTTVMIRVPRPGRLP
ncbi:sensor histidine kinase [Streptomyces sp. NBC_00338]|uniref:sensor histidine kinase n=1 Tax=Streptomyces sp. NBC_00338 TaxID=2975715 RepID=UPI002250E067|nr:ATP-binding protein [Streptomyces sp. NBC_00338]MCX5141817.1 ATP-binding protein [Streptomyces sp. NBC_00338]